MLALHNRKEVIDLEEQSPVEEVAEGQVEVVQRLQQKLGKLLTQQAAKMARKERLRHEQQSLEDKAKKSRRKKNKAARKARRANRR